MGALLTRSLGRGLGLAFLLPGSSLPPDPWAPRPPVYTSPVIAVPPVLPRQAVGAHGVFVNK